MAAPSIPSAFTGNLQADFWTALVGNEPHGSGTVQTSQAPTEITPEAVKKKRKSKGSNVTRACGNCRKRRTRCNGQPRCDHCTRRNEVCTYLGHRDGRKTAAKDYVELLEQRIKELERDKQSPSYATDTSPVSNKGHLSPLDQGSGDRHPERSYQLSGAFTLASTGSDFATHYGPTSALRHLPPAFMVAAEEISASRGRETQTSYEVNAGIESLNCDILMSSSHVLGLSPPLNPDLHQTLLRVFFSYLADWCLWCDEAAFAKGLRCSAESSQPIRTHEYSPFFHCAILAVTGLHSHSLFPSGVDVTAIRHSLTSRARQMMEAELLRPLTTTVKGLLLVGSIQFENVHRQVNFGWICEGMATRAAQILGLNIDCQDLVTSGRMSQATKHHRDRTFYSVYIQDILWSFIVGRTASFHIEDFVVPYPLIDPKQDAIPWRNYQNRSWANSWPITAHLRPGWKSSTFHWTCRLICLADSIHQLLYTVRPRGGGAGQTTNQSSELNVKLAAWLVDLPIPLRLEAWDGMHVPPHILAMHATFNYLRILLHRPMYNRAGGDSGADLEPDSAEVCDSAADEILKLIELFTASCGTLQFAPFLLSDIIFTVGTIYLMQVVRLEIHGEAGLSQVSISKLNTCLGLLEELNWPAASNSRDSLNRMKDERLQRPRGSASGSVSRGDDAHGLETMLRNPSTNVTKVLTSMGWRPPAMFEQSALEASHTTMPPMANENVDTGVVDVINVDHMGWMRPIQDVLSGNLNNNPWDGQLVQSGEEVLSLGPFWGEASRNWGL